MENENADSATPGRKRTRFACNPCREMKRKCNGESPCDTCRRYEYHCRFGTPPRTSLGGKRKAPEGQEEDEVVSSTFRPIAPARKAPRMPKLPWRNEARSMEANSGAIFLRRMASRLDPQSAPRLHTFAWNAFLGSRKNGFDPRVSTITQLLTLEGMQRLSLAYFKKVDPIYGFVDRLEIERIVERKWSGTVIDPMQEAVLCGIAALGRLFSHSPGTQLELDLAETAKYFLESAMFKGPTVTSVTAWVLRVVYLRITDNHHATWMASCMLIHMVESAGLHCEANHDSLQPTQPDVSSELRKRLTAVAQHLNIWTSFDFGKSRAILSNATVGMPSKRRGDQTAELMELLPFSAELDPQKSPGLHELEDAFEAVMDRKHTSPPSVLAQCNLALCLCRRMQSLDPAFATKLLDRIHVLCSKGIQAAQAILDDRSPWHHMANVPFQIICLLLAIDNPAFTTCLKDAMKCLSNVVLVYNTSATQEALGTASSLIMMHIRWKDKCTSDLRGIAEVLPRAHVEEAEEGIVPDGSDDMQWLDGLSQDLAFFPCFEADELSVTAVPSPVPPADAAASGSH
ncbi:hypothetical protein F4780DRAFT_593154 [Xylariomycetidae sp. FL0641]|nr:hypothetical protein F4780DRAFT_593154 [Xylariomycetidae sp. FL0641]